MHRIGRTGRAEQQGRAILFYSEKETALKEAIESLMNYTIPLNDFPEEVEVSSQLTPEEKKKPLDTQELSDKKAPIKVGASFHEKSAKNSKVKTEKKSYEKTLKEKYKKPIRRGDKIQNMKKKRKKKKWPLDRIFKSAYLGISKSNRPDSDKENQAIKDWLSKH